MKFKVLYRAEEERNFLPKIDTRKANWVGHILCRNRHLNPLNAELNPICHLLALLEGATIVVVSRLRVKHVIEGKREGRIEVSERRGKSRKQLLYYFQEREDTGY